jgi:hypothetical protein
MTMTLTEARQTKGAALNRLEAAAAFLGRRISSGELGTQEVLFKNLYSNLMNLYRRLDLTTGDELPGLMVDIDAELRHEQEWGCLREMAA